MSRTVLAAVLVAFVAGPLSAADVGVKTASRIGRSGGILAQSKLELPAGKITQPPLTSKPAGLEAKLPGTKLGLPPLTKKSPALETKVRLPADLSVGVEAYRNTYETPPYAYTEATVTNLGPGAFSGGRSVSVIAVFGNGTRQLLAAYSLPPLRRGETRRFQVRWPNADSYQHCNFHAVLDGGDQNDDNDLARCTWKWTGAVP